VKIEDLLRGRLAQAVKRRHGLIDPRRRTAVPSRRQHHDAACCFPGEAYRLGENEQRFRFRFRFAHVLFDNRSRYVRHNRQRRNRLFKPPHHSEFLLFPCRQLASPVQ
jgi:hypothetical protein